MFFFFRLCSTNTSDEQSFGLGPSRLTTTGPGPSSMRNQDQYAVIHISCFPADYSENLLRRHFSIEFVTLTVYTNRSGMYKLFLHPLRSSLRSHYGFIIWQYDMNFRWQICNWCGRVDISGCHTPVYKQHHNRGEESPGRLLTICCLIYNFFLLLSIFFRPRLPDQVGTPNKRLSNKRIEMIWPDHLSLWKGLSWIGPHRANRYHKLRRG